MPTRISRRTFWSHCIPGLWLPVSDSEGMFTSVGPQSFVLILLHDMMHGLCLAPAGPGTWVAASWQVSRALLFFEHTGQDWQQASWWLPIAFLTGSQVKLLLLLRTLQQLVIEVWLLSCLVSQRGVRLFREVWQTGKSRNNSSAFFLPTPFKDVDSLVC